MMKSILLKEFGPSENLFIGETNKPVLKKDELLVQVKCFGLNRADLVQRMGKYPPPPGESEILGLEISGIVVEENQSEKKFKIGDKVFGLVGGGAYGEYCSISMNQTILIPDHLSFEQAAAIPEAWFTAFQALHLLSDFKIKNQSFCIHAASSGVGTALIQLCKLLGASTIIGTVGSDDKGKFIKTLGATHYINYKSSSGEFLASLLEITNNKGVNVIFDYVGQQYFNQNLKSLQLDGTLIIQGFLSGALIKDNCDIQPILSKRLLIIGSTLRNRDNQYKAHLVSEFSKLLPFFESSNLLPIIDTVFNYTDIQTAHKYLESNQNKGKVIIKSFNY